MSDLLWVLVVALDIIVISDVLKKLRSPVPQFLWVVAVLLLPLFGAAFWGYVQYVVPERKRVEREKGKVQKRKRR